MIDADGAIYVIGGVGYFNNTYARLNDVWVSTDGGAARNAAGGRGYLRGLFTGVLTRYLRGTRGLLSCTWVCHRVLGVL